MASKHDSSQPDAPKERLTCPDCGGHTFTFGQLTWNTQPYDSEAEDWESGEFFYESEYVCGVVCATCEEDCTNLAVQHGHLVFHEHLIERSPASGPYAVRLNRLRIPGRNGEHKSGRVTHTPHQLEFWRGTKKETCPALVIPGDLTRQIEEVSRILGMFLNERELQRTRKKESNGDMVAQA